MGYLINSNQLNTHEVLSEELARPSINNLVKSSKYRLNELIRGSVSLGGIMQLKYNLKVVPSPNHTSPQHACYYSGGYITKLHGLLKKSSKLNAIQIELPYTMRIEQDIKYYAIDVARAIYDFYNLHELYATN